MPLYYNIEGQAAQPQILEVKTTAVAAAVAVATLGAVVGQTTYISGFDVTCTGTGHGNPEPTSVFAITGLTNPLSFDVIQVQTGEVILSHEFPEPIPASAANIAIVGTFPATVGGGAPTVILYGHVV